MKKGFPPRVPVSTKIDPRDVKLVDRLAKKKYRGKRGTALRELIEAGLREAYPERATE